MHIRTTILSSFSRVSGTLRHQFGLVHQLNEFHFCLRTCTGYSLFISIGGCGRPKGQQVKIFAKYIKLKAFRIEGFFSRFLLPLVVTGPDPKAEIRFCCSLSTFLLMAARY